MDNGMSLEEQADGWLRSVRLQQTAVGTGVFANRFFEVGDTVGWITGEIFHDPRHSSPYCVELGAALSIEPHPPFRFLNHSCDPNCYFVSEMTDEQIAAAVAIGEQLDRLLALDVRRTIYPGEELTIDYQWPAESAIPCQCGSDKCRGWVVDESELELVFAAYQDDKQLDGLPGRR